MSKIQNFQKKLKLRKHAKLKKNQIFKKKLCIIDRCLHHWCEYVPVKE